MLSRNIKRRRADEDEESAFVSMTDLTISFLIIMMILLAFFASRFSDDEVVSKSKYDAAQLQIRMLEDQVRLLSLRAEISPEDLATIRAELEELRDVEEINKQLERRIEELLITIQELQARLSQLDELDPLERYLTQSAISRKIALERLRAAIKTDFPDLDVVISQENDAIRFKGEGLFETNVSTLTVEKRAIVIRIAEILDEILPCYTIGPRAAFDMECNPGFGVIETVQIEGHTDSVGSNSYNMRLGSDRALSTYAAMVEHIPILTDHRNADLEPVISIAGYGEDRPVASNLNAEGRSTNRRIDMRFIMYTPVNTDELSSFMLRLSEEYYGASR